jgi:hypothetical protein
MNNSSTTSLKKSTQILKSIQDMISPSTANNNNYSNGTASPLSNTNSNAPSTTNPNGQEPNGDFAHTPTPTATLPIIADMNPNTETKYSFSLTVANPRTIGDHTVYQVTVSLFLSFYPFPYCQMSTNNPRYMALCGTRGMRTFDKRYLDFENLYWKVWKLTCFSYYFKCYLFIFNFVCLLLAVARPGLQ